MSHTSAVTPGAVDRIGLALAAQPNDLPEVAFDDGPANWIGAILNSTSSALRDDVLTGLDAVNQAFAQQVRRAIFTFANIPERITPLDVLKITRDVDQTVLVTALATAAAGELGQVAEFLLENMSRRLADALREEMAEQGSIKPKDGEEAMTQIVNNIRRLQVSGEITLIQPSEVEDVK